MWTELITIIVSLVAGAAVIGFPLGMYFKSWAINRAEVAKAKFDAAVARAVAELKK